MNNDLGVYHDVTGVEIVGDYVLLLTFDDGTEQTIDFSGILLGPIFEPLRNLDEFNKVIVNEDTGTIEWPSGADFNPTLLHDWPRHKDRIIAERRQRYATAKFVAN